MSAFLRMFATLIFVVWANSGWASFTCGNGANVKDESYCRFFYHYANAPTQLDDRIASNLSVANSDQTRSIALIVGISEYPNIPNKNLPPVKVDVENLKSLLKESQAFDEIIVLENADATQDRLSYFLNTYLIGRAQLYSGKARFLFAYSGHGVPASPEVAPIHLPPYLVLSAAASLDGSDPNLYSLDQLRASLESLAGSYFHVLALINACYGGSIFDVAATGGNESVPNDLGAHALTAGSNSELVWSLGGPGQGSIFFDTLVSGVKSGQADYTTGSDENGKLIVDQNEVVRLGPLVSYLTDAFRHLSNKRTHSKPPQDSVAPPWVGSVEKIPRVSRGAFFFLSPRQPNIAGTSTARVLEKLSQASGIQMSAVVKDKSVLESVVKDKNKQTAQVLPPAPPDASPALAGATFEHLVKESQGPVSSAPNRPDIKIFNPPDVYPIRGVDVSHFEGAIDWKVVAKVGIDFAYIRATKGTTVDPAFAKHWQATASQGMAHGAYHVFSYCQPVQAQLELFEKVVHKEDGALPVAIDLESYLDNLEGHEAKCASATSDGDLREKVWQLASSLHTAYGKVPVISGNRKTLSRLLDDRFSHYMIWFVSWAKGQPLNSRSQGATRGRYGNSREQLPWMASATT